MPAGSATEVLVDTDMLVDTDVLVDHLRARQRLPIDGRFAYSVVSRFELFAGRATEEGAVNDLLQPHREIAVDRAIAKTAGRIRREDRLEPADALIAATALEHRLALVTRNRRDFEKVRDLRVRDPKSL